MYNIFFNEYVFYVFEGGGENEGKGSSDVLFNILIRNWLYLFRKATHASPFAHIMAYIQS